MAPPSPIIISGPSGVGKTTICSRLMSEHSSIGLEWSISDTTREPRANELDSVDYFFTPEDKFHRMVMAGEFIEHDHHYGHWYGTRWKNYHDARQAGKHLLLDIDASGARSIRGELPESWSFFILPPKPSVLRRRLEDRGTPLLKIRQRMSEAEQQCAMALDFDYIILNQTVAEAAARIAAIIESAKVTDYA